MVGSYKFMKSGPLLKEMLSILAHHLTLASNTKPLAHEPPASFLNKEHTETSDSAASSKLDLNVNLLRSFEDCY